MIVPIELPGDSVPPLIVVCGSVPVPPRVPPLHRHAGRGRDRAVHHQRAGGDRGRAGIGVGRGQVGRARAVLRERAGAGDHAAEGRGIGAVEGERAVVEDVAEDRTGRAAIAELQRAGVDRVPPV